MENNIRGDEKKNILDNINIEYEKLEISDLLIEDEHTFLYSKYKSEQLNINNLKLEYNEKKVSWLLELSKYSRKLTEVLNSTESRLQMIEYIKERKDIFDNEKEQPLVGILKYGDKYLKQAGLKSGDLIGFKPNTEYEFIIDGQKLYRVLSNFITIKYEYQGNEEEYNPSWA